MTFVLTGCAERYSTEALRQLNPGALIVESCVRIPTVSARSGVFAHNMVRQETVSNTNGEAFERFARTADVIYRYNPNLPQRLSETLPWPYHHMRCESMAAKGPSLPKGLPEIQLSAGMREAMVASLAGATRPSSPTLAAEMAGPTLQKGLLGQVLTGPPRYPEATIEEIGQMLRDAVRGMLPTVKGPSDKEISIIDTASGQVVGGFMAGAAIGLVPGGAVVANGLEASGTLPTSTREFGVGKSAGEMVVGLVQMSSGGSMALGGGGASLTGGGAIVGVPVCVAGVGLATNGAITFYHGAKSLIVAICHWEELPAAGDTAAAAATSSTSATGGGPSTNQTPAANQAPATNPAPAAKPPTSPAKPAKKPSATKPSTGQSPAIKKACRHSPQQSGTNTITWTKCTGQMHHGISKNIHKALEKHQNLKGVYKVRDDRFVTQAIDKDAHKGYQTWHRHLDDEIVRWIDRNQTATPKDFEAELVRRYGLSDLKAIFPNGF